MTRAMRSGTTAQAGVLGPLASAGSEQRDHHCRSGEAEVEREDAAGDAFGRRCCVRDRGRRHYSEAPYQAPPGQAVP